MAVKESKSTGAEDASLGSARVKKLIIKNFRCIGDMPVEVDLDDIVVLVGPNNAGKSTILGAYEVVMNHSQLKLADFPGEVVDGGNLPEVELQTYIDPDTADKPGDQWLHEDPETGKRFVREQWLWRSPETPPERKGRRADAEDWSDNVPWGAPNVAKSHRPVPHLVDAFASPETQASSVIEIIKTVLLDQARKPVGEGADAVSTLESLRAHIIDVQAELIQSSRSEIEKIEEELSAIISEVFTGFKVKIDPRHQDISDKALNLFNTEPELRMGPTGGHSAPIEKQGSGARRTLLWSALRLVGERGGAKKPAARGRPKAAKADPGSGTAVLPEPPSPNNARCA
jgi:putative ATP-dependent endonuclease of OLD family